MSITQLKTRGSAFKISKWRQTRRTNFIGACARKYPSAVSQFSSMNAFRFCNACLERRNEIRANWEHIYIEHSYRTGVDDVSLFRSDISLLVYYNTFIAELQEGNLQGEPDLDHGSERLVYYCPFDFVVGTFPDRNRCRRGGRIIHYETYFVKVVCATSKCHNQLCRRLFPTFVITMYPHIGYN